MDWRDVLLVLLLGLVVFQSIMWRRALNGWKEALGHWRGSLELNDKWEARYSAMEKTAEELLSICHGYRASIGLPSLRDSSGAGQKGAN